MTALLAVIGGWIVITAVLLVGAAWAVRRLLETPPDRDNE